MIGRLHAFVLDCPDPVSLAQFYSAITGWKVANSEPDWVSLDGGGGARLSFQRVADYQPPQWPSSTRPQQAHIDIYVEDADEGERKVLELGATPLPTPPDADDFRVYSDPAGHPFCLCVE